MGAEKGKKQRSEEVEEERNGVEEVIDEKLVQCVEKLQSIQEELEKINEEASEKVLELEQQFNAIRKPVYDQRNDVIKSIPDFWLTAFMSHPALTELLTEEDQKIFKYLDNLEVEDFKDVKSGYSITFMFKPNPHFEDTKLTKTFSFLEEGVTKITATNIKWKEGMGMPNGTSEEKKGNKRSLAEESFFSWFTESEFKGDMYEISDEVADIIKDDLWPNPLAYFNNEVEEDLEMDDDEDDEGSDGSEDDDEDEDAEA
ncbi:NAP1-related protein 2-like [Salvia splendens]|uniref:NAP1-related protein 2-like n=1 Tax=Salvia splendens TaxID=180675 RepID=UPI001C2531A2|nr:NAP1-related protein 2-like [Salvia splendens]